MCNNWELTINKNMKNKVASSYIVQVNDIWIMNINLQWDASLTVLKRLIGSVDLRAVFDRLTGGYNSLTVNAWCSDKVFNTLFILVTLPSLSTREKAQCAYYTNSTDMTDSLFVYSNWMITLIIFHSNTFFHPTINIFFK